MSQEETSRSQQPGERNTCPEKVKLIETQLSDLFRVNFPLEFAASLQHKPEKKTFIMILTVSSCSASSFEIMTDYLLVKNTRALFLTSSIIQCIVQLNLIIMLIEGLLFSANHLPLNHPKCCTVLHWGQAGNLSMFVTNSFRIKHENVVGLEDFYESRSHYYLVMQL